MSLAGGALWGLRPLSSVVSSLSNFQYGWNDLNLGYAVVAASVNDTC